MNKEIKLQEPVNPKLRVAEVNSSFCPMLKVKLQLKAEIDIERTGWKKGDTLELVNEIFNKDCGLAYIPLDKGWEILKMEVLESDPN